AIPDPETTGAGTRLHADPAALDELATWLVGARQPVIIAGYLGRNHKSFDLLVQLAEATGAAVIDQHSRFNFPSNHPLNLSGASARYLGDADLVLALDVKDLYGALNRVDMSARTSRSALGEGCRVAEIGLRDLAISKWSEEFQQLMPVDLQVIADTSAALPELLSRVQARIASDAGARERVAQRKQEIAAIHDEARKRWQDEAGRAEAGPPIPTARLAREVGAAIAGKDWVVSGANAVINWMLRLQDFEKP